VQFHLNGFLPGDPAIDKQLRGEIPSRPVLPLPSEVDVLIVGCGPAGLTLAAMLSQFKSVSVCVVDQKVGPLLRGQADGIACRNMEMFQAFGFADRVLREAYWVNETAFWKPHISKKNHISRQDKVQDTEDGLSEFPHVILNQARVHDFFLNVMQTSATQLRPHYARTLRSVAVQTDEKSGNSSFPVKAYFQSVNADADSQQTIQPFEQIAARYVVGCDGARSVVRESIGLELKGDSANQAWGVMDVLAVTNFPDVRFKCLIQSTFGSMVLIPREGGYLLRLYVELEELGVSERVVERNITSDDIAIKAQEIFQPYTLDIKEIAWWSVYQIGQRLCDKFDNVPESEITYRSPRVFIAGDACHTHSPKAGQGMNVSMQDSFNLGWKLAAVIQGQCSEEVLHTYSSERQSVARELIEFDQQWSKIVSSANQSASDEVSVRNNEVLNANITPLVTTEELQQYFLKHGRYTAGTAIHYKPSIICATNTYQHLANGFKIGMRFHSAPVLRISDSKPMELGHVVLADGRWRLFLFADRAQPDSKNSALAKLCGFLQSSKKSPLLRFTPVNADIDSVFDIRVVFQQPDITVTDVPDLLFPGKGKYKLHDYEKCFCIDYKSGKNIFELRDVDAVQGCVVVVRPDQYVANVLPMDNFDAMATFFNEFMIPV